MNPADQLALQAEFRQWMGAYPEPGWYGVVIGPVTRRLSDGTLAEDLGETWECSHIHSSGLAATACAKREIQYRQDRRGRR